MNKVKKRREELMSYIQPIPSPFKVWVENNLPRRLYYKPVSKQKVYVQCIPCGGTGEVARPKAIRVGKSIKCPFCNKKAIVYSLNAKGTGVSEGGFALLQKTPEGVVLRQFFARRIYWKKDDRIEPTTGSYERHRIFISEGKWEAYAAYYGETGWHRQQDGYFYEQQLYPYNLNRIFSDFERFKYCPIRQYAREVKTSRFNCFLADYSSGLERLIKTGNSDVVDSIMRWGSPLSDKALNMDGRSPWEILNLPKDVYRSWRSVYPRGSANAAFALRAFQDLKEATVEEIKVLVNDYSEYEPSYRRTSITRLLASIKAKATVSYVKLRKMGIGESYQKLHDYEDYLNMGIALGYRQDKSFIYPKDFQKEHDRLVEEMRIQKERLALEEDQRKRQEMKRLKKAFEKKVGKTVLTFSESGLVFKGLWSPEDLRKEGRELHHCVGSYVDRVAEGKTMIFAVRRACDIKKPFCTFEYHDGNLIQLRSSHNQDAPENVKEVVNKFVRMLAKKSA